MTPQLWIGLGFTAVLVIFLIISYFAPDRPSQNHTSTLRFLTALCAGFAGGFLTGEALFRLENEMANGFKLIISGTAGTALFFTIWLTRPRSVPASPPLPNTFIFSILNNWTFEETVNTIAKAAKGVAKISGFTPAQLSLIMPSTELKNVTAKEAIEKLKLLNGNLPDYTVSENLGIYTITV